MVICDKCGKGYAKIKGTCQPCNKFCGGEDSECESREDMLTCTSCGPGLFLYEGECTRKCPKNFVKNTNWRKCVCKKGFVKVKGRCKSCSKYCTDGSKCKRKNGKVVCTGGKQKSSEETSEESSEETKVTLGQWQDWEPCSATCGGGEKLRRRTCKGRGIF